MGNPSIAREWSELLLAWGIRWGFQIAFLVGLGIGAAWIVAVGICR